MATRVTDGARRERHEKRETTRKARENGLSPASYPDVSLDVRAKEDGKETTGETSGRSCFQDGGKNNGGPIYNF